MAHHDVIVVGAGFAGLTAARELSRADTRSLVLEARDRIGGRTWTTERLGRTWSWAAPGCTGPSRTSGPS